MHCGFKEQWSSALTQNNPSKALHDAVPHAQATEFADEPSTLEQVLPREHVLKEDSQYNPVLLVHAVVPHIHGATFDIVAVVCEHTGPTMQMHRYVVSQPLLAARKGFNTNPFCRSAT